MKKDIYTIYLKKKDFDFVEKEIGVKNLIEFEEIKEIDNTQYKIKIHEAELEAFAHVCAHSCDHIESDRKARRLDNFALMLENYLDKI